MARESQFQTRVRRRLAREYPGCVVIKLDPADQQGMLDLLVLWEDKWAALEVKAYRDAAMRPNQQYFVNLLNAMSFAAVIYPSNEEEVFCELHEAFRSRGPARVS